MIKWCIIEFQPFLKHLRYHMKINMAFEKKSARLALLSLIDEVIQKKVNMLLVFSLIFQKPSILLTMIFCWTN